MRNACVRVVCLAVVLAAAVGFEWSAWAEYMQCDRRALNPSISADGNIIALDSCSSNWSGNLNVMSKVFVYHRERHKILNIGRNGPYNANSDLTNPFVSADGGTVVYESGADNLIGGITTNFFVTNNTINIYACEIEEGDFSSPAPGFTHKLINVSAAGAQANRGAEYPVCSSNARFVAFWTKADNLDPDTVDTNYCEENWIYTGGDIYLRDRDLDGNGVFDEEGEGKTKTTRVSHDSDIGIWHEAWWGSLSISADGRYVSYTLISAVNPLGRGLGTCVYRVADGAVTLYRPQSYDDAYNGHLSPDGGYLALGADFGYGSGYYRTLMYTLPDTNWWYAAVPMNATTGISVGCCSMSTGAHFMAFYSGNTNLVAGDGNHKYDVFVRVATGDPRNAQSYELVSKSTAGALGDDDSGDGYGDRQVGITPEGRFVVFVSAATNLVAVDTNALQDVFIRDRWSNTTEIVAQKIGGPVFPAGAALTVSQVTNTSAYFQWTAAQDDYPIWQYELTLSSSAGSSQVVVNGSTTSRLVAGLKPGRAYTATLYAYDGGGRHSDPLSASFTTTGSGGAAVINDYDGDGKSDCAVFDQNSGCWYVVNLNGASPLAWAFQWGWSGAWPVSGDYDGDGMSDCAVFDQNSGCWYVVNLNGATPLAWAFSWGWPGARPVSGDYDGDGISDCAVFDQNSGWWYVVKLNGATPLAWAFQWGWPGAWPVSGDYDGDGLSDCAVFDQNSGWWYVTKLDGTVLGWAFQWGWPGAWPVSGDYDGDGLSDCAVFDQNSGWWYVIKLNGVTPLGWAFQWGWPGAWPVGTF